MAQERKTYPKSLIDAYAKLIHSGKRSIEDVQPEALRELVAEEL